MTGITDRLDPEGRILIIQRARALFEAKVDRVGFPDSLRAFSRATGIEVSEDYQVGLAAATTNSPAYNYIHVYCQKSPPDEVTAVTGWEKGAEGGFWSFTPTPVLGFTNHPGDFEPIQVFFDVAEDLELEAIVGRCMWAQASAIKSSQFTQGLIIRAGGARWALTVGHGFNDTASTSAENAVRFCGLAQPAVPNGQAQECTECRTNKCNSECKTLPVNTRVTVASGVNNIVTFNPEIQSLNWLDFGAYNVPTNNAIQLNILSVREVRQRTGQLQFNNPTAYDEVAGPANGIQSVATDILDTDYLEFLSQLRPTGVYLFKRGKKTGWTFARLLTVTKTRIQAECIGQKTGKGDCGAIWWVIDAFNNTASPVGYHRARSNMVAHIVPYLTALEQLAVRDQRFVGCQFQPLDSYTW